MQSTHALPALMMATWIIITPPWRDGAVRQEEFAPLSRWQPYFETQARTFRSKSACERYVKRRVDHAVREEIMVWCERPHECNRCIDAEEFRRMKDGDKTSQ